MVTAEVKGVKVVLNLVEGSQTVADCNHEATDDQLYSLATAVAQLVKEDVEAVTKVVETTLINEA